MSEDLEQRIALLEEKNVALEQAIADLHEILSKPQEVSSFEDADPETISIWRKGSVLWYVVDKINPDTHYDIPGNRVEGQFQSLEVKEKEYKGKSTKMLILTLRASRGSKPYKRIRIGAPGTVSAKTFCEQFSHVPDSRIGDDLVFSIKEGKDDSAVAVEVIDPRTGKSFRPMPNLADSEKEEASVKARGQWADEGYWQVKLDEAISRIGGDLAPSKPVAIEPIAQKPRPELHDVEMSERRKEVAAAMVSANVSREDAIAFVSRKFKKQQSIEMTFAELNDFIYWLNMVQIVHGEMDRIGFTFDQESEMVSQAGQLAKKKLESDRISALDTSDLEGAIAWLGQLPDKSAQKGSEEIEWPEGQAVDALAQSEGET